MKQFQYTIKDALGVHARPAGLLVKLAKQYTSTITIEKNGKTCDMRKLMAGHPSGRDHHRHRRGRRRGRCHRGCGEVPDRERLSIVL